MTLAFDADIVPLPFLALGLVIRSFFIYIYSPIALNSFKCLPVFVWVILGHFSWHEFGK